ncbi:MAG: hypothetical protein ABSE07_03190 [Methanoregula sp.]
MQTQLTGVSRNTRQTLVSLVRVVQGDDTLFPPSFESFNTPGGVVTMEP